MSPLSPDLPRYLLTILLLATAATAGAEIPSSTRSADRSAARERNDTVSGADAKAAVPDKPPEPVLLPAPSETVLRCIAPDGRVTFSNVGCAPGQRRESLLLKPSVMDSRGLRDWARRNPSRREAAVRERRSSPAREPLARDSIACENAMRGYRFEAGYRMARRGSLGPLREEVRLACAGR